MFRVTEEGHILVTRGDALWIELTMSNDQGGEESFRIGQKVRFKVFEKNNCSKVWIQEDYAVGDETESVQLYLSGEKTAIGDLIRQPTEYWYEIELDPDDEQERRTIVGYDENGPRIFMIFPEGSVIEKGV